MPGSREINVPPPDDPRRQLLAGVCLACLPDMGVDGSGVSVLSTLGVPSMAHATDELAAHIEELQFTLGEGPCIDASESGSPVLVADLDQHVEAEEQRWPVFSGEARDAGVRAVFAFPIRMGAVALGTMDMYRTTPGELSREQLSAGLSTVDRVGAVLVGLDPADAAYPMTVHQATGRVMVQLGSSIEVALVRLRAAAYVEGLTMAELAAEVLTGRRRFEKEEQ